MLLVEIVFRKKQFTAIADNQIVMMERETKVTKKNEKPQVPQKKQNQVPDGF